MSEDHHDRPHAPDHPMTEFEWRVEAVQALLIEKGVFTADEVRRQVEEMDDRSPALGAKVIARAWVDPAFKARLLADARSAILELGIDFRQEAALVAVENTAKMHHVVVCTLCSCYPRGLLGYPPDWYKSLNYRSRVVVDPRGVLKEFGTELPTDVEVRVLDSTADMRYLVIPVRPAGTEGMSEEKLADLVTRDSMIGVRV
jgi:nitrile hydratase